MGHSARREAFAFAESIGATINVIANTPAGLDVEIVAPERHRWGATDTHAIVCSSIGVEPRPPHSTVWEGLLTDMREGFHPCDDAGEGAGTLELDDAGRPYCEWCDGGDDAAIHQARGLVGAFTAKLAGIREA